MSKRHDFEKNYAIIIGINNYTERPLRVAKNDAEKLAQILSSEEQNEDEQYKVLLLTDEEATHTKLSELLETLKEGKIRFPDETVELKENNRLLIYFSGHGVAYSLQTSQIVRDDKEKEKILKQQYLQCQDGKQLLLKDLFDAIKPLNCRHLLLILDCCYAGQAINNTGLEDVYRTASFDDDSKIQYERQYKLMFSQPAWTAITSSGYEEALDSKNSHQTHSYFAQALFKGLDYKTAKKSDSNDDDIITDNEIYTYLRNDKFVNEYQFPQKFSLTFTGKKQSGQYFFLLPDFEPTNLEEIKDISSPYKGLFSYEKDDALIFKGRNRLVEELFKRVYEENHKLTVVTGASGSGKSSLVKAGLSAKIEKENNSAQSNTSNNLKLWKISEPIRPGKFPFKALLDKTLQALQGSEVMNSDIDRKLERFYDKLNQDFRTSKGFVTPEKEKPSTNIENAFNELTSELIQQLSNNQNLLLVIDQFEELVTLCQPLEREYFLKLLAQMLNTSENLKLVLTVRSDFEIYFRGSSTTSNSSSSTTDSDISQYWSKEARLVVGEMNIDELRQAIEKPARRFGVDFESDQLVNEIIDDVRGMPGALALLSFTLEELYQKAKSLSTQNSHEPITITKEHYNELGGVVNALTNKATEAYNKLGEQIELLEEDEDKVFTKEYEKKCEKSGNPIPAEDESAGEVRQAMMKQLMLRMVTTQRGKLAKRPVPISELEYPDWRSRYKNATYRICQVIDRLIKERLIVSNLYEYEKYGKKVEIRYVEPAHDALILYWDKLSKKSEVKQQEQESQNQVQEQGWIEEQEENLALRDRLIAAIQDWQERKQEQKKMPLEFLRSFKYQKQAIDLYDKLIYFSIKIIDFAFEIEVKQELVKRSKKIIFRLALILLRLVLIVLGLILILYGLIITILLIVDPTFRELLLIFLPFGLVLSLLGLFLISPKFALKFLKFLIRFFLIRLIRRSDRNAENPGNSLENNSPQLEQTSNLLSKEKKSNNNAVNRDNYLWENDARLEQVRQFLYSQDSWLNKNETDFVRQSVIRKRQGEFKLSIGAIVLIGVAAILTGIAWSQQREASLKNVHALRQSAEAHLRSKNDLDAAVDILRARKVLQGFWIEQYPTALAEVQGTLHRVFYETTEHNRLQNRGVIYNIALSSDGKLLAAVGEDDKVTIYRVPPDERILWTPINNFVRRYVPKVNQPDLTLGNNKPKELKSFSTEQGNVLSVAFLPLENSTKLLATGGEDGTVKLWKIKQVGDKVELEATKEPIKTKQKKIYIAFAPQGKMLATVEVGGTVKLWKIEQKKGELVIPQNSQPISLPEKEVVRVYSVAFSSNGLLAIVGEKHVKIWDTNNNKELTTVFPKEYQEYPESVFSVAFTHDNKLATGADGMVKLWEIKQKDNTVELTLIKDLKEIPTKQGNVYSMAFSYDRKLATLGADDRVILWDWDTSSPSLKQLHLIQAQEQFVPINCVTYSLDGKQLVTGDNSGTVRVWDASGKPLSRFSTEQGSVRSIALSSNGKIVATVGNYGKVSLWDTNLGEPLNEESPTNQRSVAFTPDDRLATGGEDGRVKLWKIENEKLIPDPRKPIETNQKTVYEIAFRKDNQRVVLATLGNKNVNLWDNSSSKSIEQINLPSTTIKTIALSMKGMLAMGDDRGRIELWDITKQRKRMPFRSLPTQQGMMKDLAFSSENKLATVGEDGIVKLWNIQNKLPIPILQKDIAPSKLVFVPNENEQANEIAIVGQGGTVKIKTVNKENQQNDKDTSQSSFNKSLNTNLSQLSQSSRVVGFSPDGKRFATFKNDKTIELWNISEKGKPEKIGSIPTKQNQEPKVVTRVEFSPNGEKLVTFENDKTIKLWDISLPDKPASLGSIPTKITHVSFNPKGDLLATIDNSNRVNSNRVKLWDISEDKPKPLDSIRTEQDKVTNIAFSPDGILATGAEDGTVRLGNIDGVLKHQINTLQGKVKSVVFSPNGKLLATIGEKENTLTLKVWYALNNRLHPFKAKQTGISSVAFSPDSTLLATAKKGTIELWQLAGKNDNKLAAAVCNLVKDYLENNPDLEPSDQNLCDDIEPNEQSRSSDETKR